jgi:hypothetical protein
VDERYSILMRSQQRQLVAYENLLLTRRFYPWRTEVKVLAQVSPLPLRDSLYDEVYGASN